MGGWVAEPWPSLPAGSLSNGLMSDAPKCTFGSLCQCRSAFTSDQGAPNWVLHVHSARHNPAVCLSLRRMNMCCAARHTAGSNTTQCAWRMIGVGVGTDGPGNCGESAPCKPREPVAYISSRSTPPSASCSCGFVLSSSALPCLPFFLPPTHPPTLPPSLPPSSPPASLSRRCSMLVRQWPPVLKL